PIAQLLPGQERDAELREILVAPGVVAVHMCDDQEPDPPGRYVSDGCDNLLRQRGELTVHHQNTVGSGQDPDGAALALERIEGRRDLRGLDFNLAEVRRLALARDDGAGREQTGEDGNQAKERSLHDRGSFRCFCSCRVGGTPTRTYSWPGGLSTRGRWSWWGRGAR